MAWIARFELLTNLCLAQLSNISNYCNHNCDVVLSIMYLSPYKLICKLFNRNPDF